jgi:hypothetical protein
MKHSISAIALIAAISATDAPAASQDKLAQQRACYDQAERLFKSLNNEDAIWESHYNSKLNRCLVKITDRHITREHEQFTFVWVYDADTRHVIARYAGPVRAMGKVFPCNLNGQQQMCEDVYEFNDMLHMEFGVER